MAVGMGKNTRALMACQPEGSTPGATVAWPTAPRRDTNVQLQQYTRPDTPAQSFLT